MKQFVLILTILPCFCIGADEATLEAYYQLDDTKPLRYALHDLIDDHDLVTYENAKAPLQDFSLMMSSSEALA